ncbi:NADH-quinone oxidoreductase subunit N [Parabacteroides pacaensis]|uniref:NADH-quinone oxidoreductase subunit N n=1 Tax=Parabacteroides pacaensis TaxID=2086575 RepID=UPI000D0E50FE|nr:NADH-quinone oxidoreductase subunit N [Parabacteroides pacaensis]
MNYIQFIYMRPEITLIAVIVLLFLYDMIAGERARRFFQPAACILLGIYILMNIFPQKGMLELFGGMYQTLPIQGIVKSILAIGTLIVFLQADAWLKREDTNIKRGEFYILILCTLLGMNFMISAGNFLLFFIGLELASIPMACLVAFDKYRHHSAEAGAKYILSSMFSSGLMLYGISFIYGTTGTFYFTDIPAMLQGTPLQILALVFFFSGLGFKISLVPFHLWTADVYEGAPTTVTSYLSVISKGSAVFVLMTIFIKVFAPMVTEWQELLYIIIIASITIANLFAIRQKNMKRFLAFSSISQAGYIMLGVISGNAMGMTALVYYVLVYLVANLAAFGIISVIEQHSNGKTDMDDYNGLYQTNPRLSFLMTLSLFSLAGIPPFAGFFSKFFIFMAAFQEGFHLLVFIALLNTVISLFYYLRVVKAMYITPNEHPIPVFHSDNYTRIGLVLCLAGVLLLGIISSIYDGIHAFAFGI